MSPSTPVTTAMAGITIFNSVICPASHLCLKRKNRQELRSNLTNPVVVSTSAPFWRSRRDGGEDRRAVRARAVARTPVEEGVADAKRVIDEVLTGVGGGLTEVSWALYADEEKKKALEGAVTQLSACRGQNFGEFLSSDASHGVWEVFYAPHIFRLSSAFGTQIKPLQYILNESGFSSHVRYFSPLGAGWLSAAGDYVVREDGKTVEILFDSFWADAGRDNLQPDPKGKGSIERTLVNLAGRGAFISAFSVYPVCYADADVTVFEFTTLRTKIAARKIRPG